MENLPILYNLEGRHPILGFAPRCFLYEALVYPCRFVHGHDQKRRRSDKPLLCNIRVRSWHSMECPKSGPMPLVPKRRSSNGGDTPISLGEDDKI